MAILQTEDGPVLAIAVGDGAGSSARADVGSRVATAAAVAAIGRTCTRRAHVGTIQVSDVEGWVLAAQGAVAEQARRDQALLREYRTTLLVAVIGRRHSVYAQIGDGAIVVSTTDRATGATGFVPIFWPDNGEYANATYFITDPESLMHLQVVVGARAPEDVAVLTDGLQMLALSYRDRTAHAPFFHSMLGAVRAARRGAVATLTDGLTSFLGSEAVLARTDDDKTLVLAARLPDRRPRVRSRQPARSR